MKKYMKPALEQHSCIAKNMIAMSLNDRMGGGPNLSGRNEDDDFLEFQEMKDNLNPWKK